MAALCLGVSHFQRYRRVQCVLWNRRCAADQPSQSLYFKMERIIVSVGTDVQVCSFWCVNRWRDGFPPSSRHPGRRDSDTWCRSPPRQAHLQKSLDCVMRQRSSWDPPCIQGSISQAGRRGWHMVEGHNLPLDSVRCHHCHKCTAHILMAGSSAPAHTPPLGTHTRSSRTWGSSRWGSGWHGCTQPGERCTQCGHMRIPRWCTHTGCSDQSPESTIPRRSICCRWPRRCCPAVQRQRNQNLPVRKKVVPEQPCVICAPRKSAHIKPWWIPLSKKRSYKYVSEVKRPL